MLMQSPVPCPCPCHRPVAAPQAVFFYPFSGSDVPGRTYLHIFLRINIQSAIYVCIYLKFYLFCFLFLTFLLLLLLFWLRAACTCHTLSSLSQCVCVSVCAYVRLFTYGFVCVWFALVANAKKRKRDKYKKGGRKTAA